MFLRGIETDSYIIPVSSDWGLRVYTYTESNRNVIVSTLGETLDHREARATVDTVSRKQGRKHYRVDGFVCLPLVSS